jgi:hypothetical protein
MLCPYSSVWIEHKLAELETGVQILVGALILRVKLATENEIFI